MFGVDLLESFYDFFYFQKSVIVLVHSHENMRKLLTFLDCDELSDNVRVDDSFKLKAASLLLGEIDKSLFNFIIKRRQILRFVQLRTTHQYRVVVSFDFLLARYAVRTWILV